MELRVESVLVLAVAVPERLAIAPGRAVGLEDLDALTGVGHERTKGQGGESTSNDEIVWFHISRLGESVSAKRFFESSEAELDVAWGG